MIDRWLALPVLVLALCVGCSDPGIGGPRGGGPGTGGSGSGATGGTGGEPYVPECDFNFSLCTDCPADEDRCESNDECSLGHVCIESGCNTNEGEPILVCELAIAPFCVTTDDCPEGRQCVDLGLEGLRCVKTTPGCDTDFDCVFGFSCEEGSCFDRRVPCVLDEHCPMGHACEAEGTSSFCHRVHVTCEGERDCSGIAPRCEDVDGDGITECAGTSNPNDSSLAACVNSDCVAPEAPVCEVSEVGSLTTCGQYGLCVDQDDCAEGFECVGLWMDGRKECVPSGGLCSHITDCPARQVCASPRTGGAPACQAGTTL